MVKSSRESSPDDEVGAARASPPGSAGGRASTRCRLDHAVAKSSTGYATRSRASGEGDPPPAQPRPRPARWGDEPAGRGGGAGDRRRRRRPRGRAAAVAQRQGTTRPGEPRAAARRTTPRRKERRPGERLVAAEQPRPARSRCRARPVAEPPSAAGSVTGSPDAQPRSLDRRAGVHDDVQSGRRRPVPRPSRRATPGCSHTAFAPTAIASSTTSPDSSLRTKAVHDVERPPGTGGRRRGSRVSPCTVSAFGCTGTILHPEPLQVRRRCQYSGAGAVRREPDHGPGGRACRRRPALRVGVVAVATGRSLVARCVSMSTSVRRPLGRGPPRPTRRLHWAHDVAGHRRCRLHRRARRPRSVRGRRARRRARRPLERAPRRSCPTVCRSCEGTILDRRPWSRPQRRCDEHGGHRRRPPRRLQVRRRLGAAPAAHLRAERRRDAGRCSRRWPAPVSRRSSSPPAPPSTARRTSIWSRSDRRRSPESPYGESKLIGEWLLRDVARGRRPAAHVAAVLQRRRLRRSRRSTTPARTTSSRSCSTR